jgi:hypothetical protein
MTWTAYGTLARLGRNHVALSANLEMASHPGLEKPNASSAPVIVDNVNCSNRLAGHDMGHACGLQPSTPVAESNHLVQFGQLYSSA